MDDGLGIGVDRAAVDLESRCDEGGGEAELIEELEGAAPDDERFRLVARGGRLVDDASTEAVAVVGGGCRQTDGAGADDERVELRIWHGNVLVTGLWPCFERRQSTAVYCDVEK
jgi:hypothetical protein